MATNRRRNQHDRQRLNWKHRELVAGSALHRRELCARSKRLDGLAAPDHLMTTKLWAIKTISRVALGLVWFYEGLVPKILFLNADQLELVQRSGIVWRTPEWTLQMLGFAQIGLGIWLLAGWTERFTVAIATVSMLVLIALVARGNPAMLTDPYGALIKDLCLIACALTVWCLAPVISNGTVAKR